MYQPFWLDDQSAELVIDIINIVADMLPGDMDMFSKAVNVIRYGTFRLTDMIAALRITKDA